MAANRSPLAERVARLLGVAKLDRGLRSTGLVAGLLCVCASVLAGNALFAAAQANKATADQSPAPVVQEVPAEDHGAIIVVRPAKPQPKPVTKPNHIHTDASALASSGTFGNARATCDCRHKSRPARTGK
jgi:hypothetical protein